MGKQAVRCLRRGDEDLAECMIERPGNILRGEMIVRRKHKKHCRS